MARKEFSDSAEATDFMETLHGMLTDERLADWADATDDNFSTSTSQTLSVVRDKYTNFINEMYEAGE